jgi:orotate phosphoribosyltransferase
LERPWHRCRLGVRQVRARSVYELSQGFIRHFRKEAKSHGEGGTLVGATIADKRVLILDDVVTSGTSIRVALDNIQNANGKAVGVVLCLDREEVGSDVDVEAPNPGPKLSTVNQVAQQVNGPVRALVRMRDLMSWLDSQGRQQELQQMAVYWQKYGIGE